MSDMNTPEDTALDGQLSSYYGALGDSAVPVKLHGRIVDTLESRGRQHGFNTGGRGLRFSRLAPAAVVVLAVVAVAVAALPWTQHGPTPLASQTVPGVSSPTGAATSFGGLTLTVMNLSLRKLNVGINEGQIADSLTCGASGTYEVAGPSARVDFSTDDGMLMFGPTYGVDHVPGHIWLVQGAMGLFEYDTEPAASDLYSICPTKVLGADPSGRVSWDLETPVVSGTTAASRAMNTTIDAAVQKLLAQARDSVLATAGDTAIITSLYYIYGFGSAQKPQMLSIQLGFTVASDPVRNLWQVLNIDLADGHDMAIEELFKSPSEGLATLSNETLKLLPMDEVGSFETAPTASNFSNWMPWPNGLMVYLKTTDPNSPLTGFTVIIPWSALESLLKPSSPVWDCIPVR